MYLSLPFNSLDWSLTWWEWLPLTSLLVWGACSHGLIWSCCRLWQGISELFPLSFHSSIYTVDLIFSKDWLNRPHRGKALNLKQGFAAFYLLFLLFTFFWKTWKNIFWPALGVHSNQTLVKIYNIYFSGRGPLIMFRGGEDPRKYSKTPKKATPVDPPPPHGCSWIVKPQKLFLCLPPPSTPKFLT